ncbi:MAG: hypothetical protein OXU61_12060 [Gammaproteobacteria bacterium]|nr:hypothetical protein [Gammaproteobacteria bacterium]
MPLACLYCINGGRNSGAGWAAGWESFPLDCVTSYRARRRPEKRRHAGPLNGGGARARAADEERKRG